MVEEKEMSETKKCIPFECMKFKIMYEKIWDKLPADILVVKCPFRIGNGTTCIKED